MLIFKCRKTNTKTKFILVQCQDIIVFFLSVSTKQRNGTCNFRFNIADILINPYLYIIRVKDCFIYQKSNVMGFILKKLKF